MGLVGSFDWYRSLHQGGKKAISFKLTCDNMITNEIFDCAIIDSTGQQPTQVRRQLKLKPNGSFTFNYDTCGWDWCQGDYFVILGKDDKVKKRWDLNLKVYGPGECPECHGSHRCTKCNGSGILRDQHTHSISGCPTCNGTGECQTCYVPLRSGSALASAVYGGGPMPNPGLSRQRKMEALRRTIADLQTKIEREEWNQRMMQWKGMDLAARTAYSSQMQLKSQYERQLLQAQYELQQLENMGSL